MARKAKGHCEEDERPDVVEYYFKLRRMYIIMIHTYYIMSNELDFTIS